jgi:hypothetical protein
MTSYIPIPKSIPDLNALSPDGSTHETGTL